MPVPPPPTPVTYIEIDDERDVDEIVRKLKAHNRVLVEAVARCWQNGCHACPKGCLPKYAREPTLPTTPLGSPGNGADCGDILWGSRISKE